MLLLLLMMIPSGWVLGSTQQALGLVEFARQHMHKFKKNFSYSLHAAIQFLHTSMSPRPPSPAASPAASPTNRASPYALQPPVDRASFVGSQLG